MTIASKSPRTAPSKRLIVAKNLQEFAIAVPNAPKSIAPNFTITKSKINDMISATILAGVSPMPFAIAVVIPNQLSSAFLNGLQKDTATMIAKIVPASLQIPFTKPRQEPKRSPSSKIAKRIYIPSYLCILFVKRKP